MNDRDIEKAPGKQNHSNAFGKSSSVSRFELQERRKGSDLTEEVKGRGKDERDNSSSFLPQTPI